MKKISLSLSILFLLGVGTAAEAQDSPMTQKPIISSSQDSASLGNQWPAKGQDSSMSMSAAKDRYYYYPERNIYYNDASRDYMYYDSTSRKWSQTKQLPSNMNLDKTAERYPFNYSGTDPWKENSSHKVKYKVKKDGTIKIKKD